MNIRHVKNWFYDLRFRIGERLIGMRFTSFPVSAMKEGAVWYDMPNYYCSTRRRFVSIYEEWLRRNVSGLYRYDIDPDNPIIYFSRLEDALLFKLVKE